MNRKDQYEKDIKDWFIKRIWTYQEKRTAIILNPQEKTLSSQIISLIFDNYQPQGANLDEFFEHENHIHPLELSGSENLNRLHGNINQTCLQSVLNHGQHQLVMYQM